MTYLNLSEDEKNALIQKSWAIHDEVESAYMHIHASHGEVGWDEKQRLLLADLSLHLFQTAIQPGEVNHQQLVNRLFAVMCVSDRLLPDKDLSGVAQMILDAEGD